MIVVALPHDTLYGDPILSKGRRHANPEVVLELYNFVMENLSGQVHLNQLQFFCRDDSDALLAVHMIQMFNQQMLQFLTYNFSKWTHVGRLRIRFYQDKNLQLLYN